jgi:hypothetical protein
LQPQEHLPPVQGIRLSEQEKFPEQHTWSGKAGRVCSNLLREGQEHNPAIQPMANRELFYRPVIQSYVFNLEKFAVVKNCFFFQSLPLTHKIIQGKGGTVKVNSK